MSPIASPALDLGRIADSSNAAASRNPAFALRRGGTTLTIRGVCKAFGGVRAIEGVDIDIAAGEIRAIIGPNGAGKSTLLNVISGIYAADSGSVTIGSDGRPITRASQLAALGIARTFQNLALFEGLTAAQNIAMGCYASRRAGVIAQLAGLGRVRREREDVKRRVDGLLAFLDLEDIRDRSIAGLPYGIRKRIELARAIVAEPRLLLLDEPLAGMNGADKPEMARLIRAARDTFGTTIVLIEHDIGVVMTLADRIAVLDYGRKIADGQPDEVRRDHAVIAAYLGQEDEFGLQDEPAKEAAA